MTIDYDKLMGWRFDDSIHSYTPRDTMLYALGVGLGADPTDEQQLRYVYEDGLQALPSMAVVLGGPGGWLRDPGTGVDYLKVVHGEQWLTLHRPLPSEGTVVGRSRVTAVVDKGADKGAVIYLERRLFPQAGGEPLATLLSSIFARGNGGFGGPVSGPTPPPHALPEGAPQRSCDLATLPRQALFYRLSGDYNPLHADPKVARSAGFPVPILHGLCTYGIAGHAILRTYCNYEASRLRALQARFSAPVYPGEILRTEMWREGGVVSFRCKAVERDVVVLANGRAEIVA
jgi:acyl dehydratase